MSSGTVVQRNIIANVIGGSWVVLLSLLVIPFQIRILGAEAYGLIGFMVSLQILLTALDLGLSKTVNREIASDTTEARKSSRALVQTATAIYLGITILISVGLIFGADWLVNRWLQLETIPASEAVSAIRILAIWVVFYWPATLYNSILTGLQRLDVVNVVRVLTVTLVQGGGIVILLVHGGLQEFLIWITVTTCVSTVALILVCTRFSPWMSVVPRFSAEAVKRVWRFSLDINLITILAIIFTQLDRILIGRLLPLRMLGYYALAYSLARGIVVIQEFLSSAMLPNLASIHARRNFEILRANYSKYSQALVYVTTLPTLLLIFYGPKFLGIWATPEAAEVAGRTLQVLAIGFMLNAAMSAPYTVAVAVGDTRVPLIVNIVALLPYVAGLYYLILHVGILGAGFSWLMLNSYYFITLLPLTERRIFKRSPVGWIKRSFAPFLLIGAALFLVGKAVLILTGLDTILSILIGGVLMTIAYILIGYRVLDPSLQGVIRSLPGLVGAFVQSPRKLSA
jgi:O-antigen/teichoic acid export membrane protein